MSDVWIKYSKKMTDTGVRYEDDDLNEKQLPCLTACPWNAFKKSGFHFRMYVFFKFDRYLR